jgi:seryl-tRNA synthetase
MTVTATGTFMTLAEDETRLLTGLDAVFGGWGERVGAAPMLLPALQSVTDLATLDVFQNFPHLTWVATTLNPQGAQAGAEITGQVPPESLRPAVYGLPSAVCYGFYLHFRGAVVPERTLVTAMNTCFRNETHYEGLRRLGAFRMREIVALGDVDHARAHLDRFDELIVRFAAALDLPLVKEAAEDPFFDPEGAQAKWQQLVPVKHEYRYGDLAIASLNEHRKFFGERCDIRGAESGAIVSTSCVAFGLERWVHSLIDRHGGDRGAALAAVTDAAAALRREDRS